MLIIATRKGVVQSPVNDKTGAEDGGGGDDTIAGGDDTQDGAKGDDGPSERELAMDAIANRHEDGINADHLKAGEKPPKAPGEDTQAGGADDQLNLQTGGDDVLAADDLARRRVRLKVDGEEIEVSGADVVRAAQKNGAADKRLEEANRLLKEARAVAAAAPGATPAASPPPVGSDEDGNGGKTRVQPAPDGGQELEASGRKFLNALFEGDEEKAFEALTKVMGGRASSSTQSEADLIAKLTPAVRQQLERESALDSFATAHQELLKDEKLARLADEFLEEVQSDKDTPRTYREQLEEAAQRTYKFTNRKAPTVSGKEGSTTSTRNQRLEAKRSADQTAGASARATEPTEPVENASSTIAEMRKNRGMEP